MSSSFKTQFGHWEVHAYAVPLKSGGFSPRAILTRHGGVNVIEHALDVDPPYEFADEHEAATHALGCAQEWSLAHP